MYKEKIKENGKTNIFIKADEGSVSIDSEEVYDNPGAKMKLFFVADDEYFFSYSTGEDMAKYYSCIYEKYDMDYDGYKHYTHLWKIRCVFFVSN